MPINIVLNIFYVKIISMETMLGLLGYVLNFQALEIPTAVAKVHTKINRYGN
jgi:hypothetical protein